MNKKNRIIKIKSQAGLNSYKIKEDIQCYRKAEFNIKLSEKQKQLQFLKERL